MIGGIRRLHDQLSILSGLIRIGADGMINSLSLPYVDAEPEQGRQILALSPWSCQAARTYHLTSCYSTDCLLRCRLYGTVETSCSEPLERHAWEFQAPRQIVEIELTARG